MYREKKQELKTRQKAISFILKISFFSVSNQYVLNNFFHKSDLPFIPAPTDKQASRQIAAILYLKSFAQVLALSNVIANRE